jgi:hypothetical protein
MAIGQLSSLPTPFAQFKVGDGNVGEGERLDGFRFAVAGHSDEQVDFVEGDRKAVLTQEGGSGKAMGFGH